MTVYTNIHFDKDTQIFTANIGNTKATIQIKKTLCLIYRVSKIGDVYTPVHFHNVEQLQAIHDYLRYGTSHPELDQIVIRVGHMDRHLNSLKWIPIKELHRKFSDRSWSLTEKNKFRQVLKTLNMPIAAVKPLQEQVIEFLAPRVA